MPDDASLRALPPLPSLDLPGLPPILDSELEQRVFSHAGYHIKHRKATSLDLDGNLDDNEKFEHVGDALLGPLSLAAVARPVYVAASPAELNRVLTTTGSVVTILLQAMFPNLRPGPATVNSHPSL
jgi:hypothetical protein